MADGCPLAGRSGQPGYSYAVVGRYPWLVVAGVAGVAVSAAVLLVGRGEHPSPRPAAGMAQAASKGDGYSNIAAADYVGPDACSDCHPDKYDDWRSSTHRVMNQLAGADAVVGDFSGPTVSYAGGQARFERAGDDYTMILRGADQLVRRYRITRTIGSRYLQEYVGVLIEGPEPAGHPAYTTEVRLPFGFWLRKQAWFHQQYFDSWFGAEYDERGKPTRNAFVADDEPWATRCAWCHNTYPFEIRARRAQASDMGYGLERFVIFDEPGAAGGGDNRLPIEQLVTVGISCESCHLGGREHAVDGEQIRFVPTSPRLVRRDDAPDLAGGRTNATVMRGVCAQCHSTPSPRYASGAVTRNSSEALDMAGGSCVSAIRCNDCHDPHRIGAGAAAAGDDPAHVSACIGCHEDFGEPAAARAHGHHDPDEVSCLDCHMPHIVQGISHVVRSHRIGPPVTRADVADGGPNACNLCHLDRSIAWTVAELARRWNSSLRLERDWRDAYGGDFDAPLGPLWLASSRPIMRVTAADAYARSTLGKGSLPAMIDGLDDPIAYYRMRMLFAIEDILGRSLSSGEYDPTAAPEVRGRAVEVLKGRLSETGRNGVYGGL